MTSQLPPKIFDHKVLRNCRDRSIANFHNYNFIHHLISDLILESIIEQNHNYNDILEIGALDHYLINNIRHKLPKSNLFSSDISSNCMKLDDHSKKVIMNDEFIAFKEESFDLICSNMNAHFYNDLLGFFIQSYYSLKNNGFFIASFIAQNSFSILKKVFNVIEVEKYQRFVPRLLPTTDVKTAGMLLQKSGFSDIVSMIEEVNIDYDDPKNIFLDIKNSEGSNIMFYRSKKFITKSFFNDICQELEKNKIGGKIKVNLNIIIISGWKK